MMSTKKTTLFAAALLMNAAVFGQTSKRTSANNYLEYGELDNAVEAIEPTITHEKTMGDPKTWFFRGKIYNKLFEVQNSEGKFKELSDDPLQIAYESFMKCKELDEKDYYAEDMKRYLNFESVYFYNLGIASLQANDYEKAATRFNNAVQLSNMDCCPALNDTLVMLSVFYGGWANDALGKLDLAEKDYLKASDLAKGLKQKEQRSSFVRLINMWHREKNTDKELEAIKLGREALGEPGAFAVEEANVFLGSGSTDKAVDPLRKAVETDPSNYSAWFALGSILEQLAKKVDESGENPEAVKMFTESREAYQRSVDEADKALASASDDQKEAILSAKFDAVYSIGASWFNMGAKMNDAASNISDQKKYDAAMVKVLEIFRKALPSLEIAYGIRPDDKGVLIALNQLYYKLGGDDPSYEQKLEEVSAKLHKK